MFYKINNKYYVKMTHHYQEVYYKNNNIIPKKGEKTRIYNPSSKIIEISYKDLLETLSKKKNNIQKDNFNIF